MFSYVCLGWGGYRDGLILYGVESYLFGCIYVISIRKNVMFSQGVGSGLGLVVFRLLCVRFIVYD